MENKNIYFTDGIKNAGLSLHHIGVQSAGLSNVGLLYIDNTTSVRCMANHITTSMLIVERTGMFYLLKLVCLQSGIGELAVVVVVVVLVKYGYYNN